MSLLVANRLEEIERIDRGGRMRAGEWRSRLIQYAKTICQPLDADYESADVVPLWGDAGWSVWYRLWTTEEGKSDLGIELTVRDRGGDGVEIEVDDLRAR